jgi:hypothetical protein
LTNWRLQIINEIIYKDMEWIKLAEKSIQWHKFKIAMDLVNSVTTGSVFYQLSYCKLLNERNLAGITDVHVDVPCDCQVLTVWV